MTEKLGFDGRVAVVSGAAGGLGREHALLLASRGARVLVNDLGGNVDGSGTNSEPSQSVVDEIVAAGGEALADGNSVARRDEAKSVIDAAIDAWGRVDIVINNAGILRDRTFAKMSEDDIDSVLSVHVKGAFYLTQRAWQYIREADYGRIIFTSSAAGLFGNFGQANYGAAKMALIGLANVLAIEGGRNNIKANVIAPVARTRMTDNLLGSLADRADPELVSPLVAWLAHDQCPVSGHIYTVGGGRVARLFIGMCAGWTRTNGKLTIEDVRDHFYDIENAEDATIPENLSDDLRALARSLK